MKEPTRTVVSLLPLIFAEKEAPPLAPAAAGKKTERRRWSGVERGEKIPRLLASNRIGRFIEGASKRIDEEIVEPKRERGEGGSGKYFMAIF